MDGPKQEAFARTRPDESDEIFHTRLLALSAVQNSDNSVTRFHSKDYVKSQDGLGNLEWVINRSCASNMAYSHRAWMGRVVCFMAICKFA
jgi:hypothetical protein